MGVMDRFRDLMAGNVADLFERHPDPDRLLAQAIAEMQGELEVARHGVQHARDEAREKRELQEVRREEAARLGDRAKAAASEGLHEEATRLRAAQDKAKTHAGTLEAEAVRAEAAAAQVQDALCAVEGLMVEARARQQQVLERLKELRRATQDGPRPQVREKHPPPPASERTRDDVERELNNLESRSQVEDRLAELKRKMGR